MAASIGVDSRLVRVEVIRVAGDAGGWHRRVKLGAFAWWIPEGCLRDTALPIEETRTEPPAAGPVCDVCWPVWPDVKGSR